MLTNPATDWLTLELAGLDDAEDDADIKGFVENTTRDMLDAFGDASTGFQQEVNAFYLDLVCLGWAVFLVEWKDGKGPRFKAVPPPQCAVAENSDGRVDTVLRRWTMTPGQMLEEFGAENVSDSVKQALEGNDPHKAFGVSHLVAPREKLPKDIALSAPDGGEAFERAARANAASKKPFPSVYFETESRHLLRLSGFDELPYMAPRWSKRSGEVYGRGPGHACLPDMRVLNRVALSQLIGAEKLADPPMVAVSDSTVGKIKTHAGGITTVDPAQCLNGDPSAAVRQLPVQYQLDVAEAVLEKRREAIRAAFLNDRIQLAGGPQMTATEVIARERKQNLVLGPVLGRLEAEFLGPLTDRVFLLLWRAGKLNAPAEYAGLDLRARYVSPIGRAQRQGEAEAFARALQYLALPIQADSTILDNFNFDAAARDSQDMFGFPSSYLRSEEEVAKLRQARAEAQQAEAMAKIAALAAKGAAV